MRKKQMFKELWKTVPYTIRNNYSEGVDKIQVTDEEQ